ncbi:MAG: PEP-CTERM sorting domain-containing protein [Thermodesulfobacteriota bacterium]
MKKKILSGMALAGLLALGAAGTSFAAPFTITSQLTGDPRPDNPDNLIVDVTILADTESADTFWTVDLNSPLHPEIKLDAFFFNLALDPADVTFSAFAPTGWDVFSPADNAAGSGSADFMFEADQIPASGAADVTNSQDLTFTASLDSGFWTEAMFLTAGEAESSDDDLGSFQLGAHLQSLTVPAGTDMSDSGFAGGNYGGNGGNGGNGTDPIPEPATMLLFGTGLVSLAGSRLRRRKR